MTPLVLESDRVRVEVLPAIGAGLGAMDVRGPDGAWCPLMRRAPRDERWFNNLSCYLLAPWPNRIAGGRFTWRGREHRVSPDWSDGTAIHGLVKDKPWAIVERSPVSAVLAIRFGAGADWPWAFECVARYEVLGDGLAARLTVRNAGGGPMPAGAGFHPFFMRQLWDDRDEAGIQSPVHGRYPARRMIPTGPACADEVSSALRAGLAVRDQRLDDVFAGSSHGATVAWVASGLEARYECSANLGHTVVYTGEPGGPRHPFFCLEPVSMVNDGFNQRDLAGSGVVELAPGQELTVAWTLRINTI